MRKPYLSALTLERRGSYPPKTARRGPDRAGQSRRLFSGLLERRGRPATGELLAHPQSEALKQLGNRLRPHLKAIALPELCERLLIRLGHTAHVDELPEEALETGRRDDLENPAGLVARVPERVPLVARLEDQVPRPGLDDVAQQCAHAPLENEAVLILARVQMQR